MASTIAGNIDKQITHLFKEKNILKDYLGKKYPLVEENILGKMV